jgi:hypothetical protein
MTARKRGTRGTRGTWRRASGCVGGDCGEVRDANGRVQVRDSKNPTGAVLTFDPDAWMDFLAELRDGGYDRTAAPVAAVNR